MLDLLTAGASRENILNGYPLLDPGDITAAFESAVRQGGHAALAWLMPVAVLARPAPPQPDWDHIDGTISMSDDIMGRILAALERLEQGQTQLRTDQVQLRTDLMARMDRLQHRMDRLDERLTMGFGYADNAANQAWSASEGSRILGEQLRSLEKLLLKLEARVTQLEERSHE